MDQSQANVSDEPNVKKQRRNDETGGAVAVDAVNVAVHEEQTADILKLDIDCFE